MATHPPSPANPQAQSGSSQSLPVIPRVSIPVHMDDALDYITHEIEAWFTQHGKPLTSTAAASTGPTRKWYTPYYKDVHMRTAITQYWRIFHMSCRNNPYHLPPAIYIFILLTLFFALVGVWGVGLLESVVAWQEHKEGWYIATLKADMSILVFPLAWTLFLHPALIANVRESLEAFGYHVPQAQQVAAL